MVRVLAKCPKHWNTLMELKPFECLRVDSFLWIVNKGSVLVTSARIFFVFCCCCCINPEPTERFLLSAWISAWLDVARWTGWRVDGLRLHIGLSAGFISCHGFLVNPFAYVHLPVGVMKRMSCAGRYHQA